MVVNGSDMFFMERLLKPSEVAETLNVSRSLVYQLIRSNVLPVVKIKSAVRIKKSDLNDFINSNENHKDYQLSLF